MTDHRRGTGVFTVVAASGMLGSQFALLADGYGIAWILWIVALALWLGLTYAVFGALTVKRAKPPLDRGISGTWLLAVVATESIAVLSAELAVRSQLPYRLGLDFLALSMWLLGAMLYLWTIALLFYRCMFFAFEPGDFSPPYWITMGAMAISTLAGSLLAAHSADASFLAATAPFIEGLTVLCWATGTWWIPLLLVLTVWRHLYARVPLRHDALYWSAVFPVGMYAACTFHMAHALGLEFLYPILPSLGYLALAVWSIAAVATASALLRAIAAYGRRSA